MPVMDSVFRIRDNLNNGNSNNSNNNNPTGMLLSSSSLFPNSPTATSTVPDLPSHSESMTANSASGGGGVQATTTITVNNIELNTAASLSDDSGVPLTTNSSISSGDSYRICRFESSEMVESDGEVSQFDSLDNCSEGGMSTENFNTLKKGPLAPIDPPPEFQDSPKTTLARSISKNIVNNLRRWTSSQSSFKHTSCATNTNTMMAIAPTPVVAVTSTTPGSPLSHKKECNMDRDLIMALGDRDTGRGGGNGLKDSYALNRHLYLSDSIINTHSDSDNIYDEPHIATRNSLGHIVDPDESSASLLPSPVPSPPPPVSMVKIKQTLCPYHEDHSRYFKAIISAQDNNISSSAAAQKFNCSGLSDIHDYDLYYGAKRNVAYHHHLHYAQCEQNSQRKILQSPLNSSNNCHNHHYYTGVNRPNSRNSLNSRLSSSHNSLSVSTANKPDDSIFITQAMSHDALLTRNEISDFYNVPIDSDIYALPIDMIPLSKSISKTFSVMHKDVNNHQQELLHHFPPSRNDTITNNENDLKFVQNIFNKGENVGQHQHQHHILLHSAELLAPNNNSNITTNTSSAESECATIIVSNANKKFRRNGNCKTTRGKHKTTDSGIHHQTNNNVVNNRTTMQMTLDEVKQFYNTLYSEGSSSNNQQHEQCQRNFCSTSCRAVKSVTGVANNNCSIGSGINSSSTTSNNNTKISNNETVVCWRLTQDRGSSIGTLIDTVSSANETVSNTKTAKTANKCSGNIVVYQHSDAGEVTEPFQTTTGVQISSSVSSPNATSSTATNDRMISSAALLGEKKQQFSLTLKQRFCSLFRFRRNNDRHHSHHHHHHHHHRNSASSNGGSEHQNDGDVNLSSHSKNAKRKNFQSRALPPLPKKNNTSTETNCKSKMEKKKAADTRPLQLTSSIEKVKDYGWYWGPLSSEAAEKVLSNEPDGSFIVRDSSDDHYIFSLSFKLNNCVRHVRIEQDQGTFSFGSYAKFKSQTITEFIEKAVEHSRSGRYLFFLHRRPEHGPMRVQLTNPVSRFKHVQSLQHMCRFVILKTVIRKDLIQTLPLPRRLLDYLNYKHCYSEQIECDSSHSQISGDGIS